MQSHLWNCVHTKSGVCYSAVFDSEHVREAYLEAKRYAEESDVLFVAQWSAMTGAYYFFVKKDGLCRVEMDWC